MSDSPPRTPSTNRTLDHLEDEDWHSTGTLRELHVHRGWPPADIARFYDVHARDVRRRLKETDLFQEDQTHPPKNGTARKLWEAGLESDTEVE